MSKSGIGRFRKAIGLTIITLLVGAVIWAFIEPHILTVKRITVSRPDVPLALDGLKIALLSDFHHGPQASIEFLGKAVAKTNALRPDLIFIAGDYIIGDPKLYTGPCLEVLTGLEAPLGVFSVFGNHDQWKSRWISSRELEQAGIVSLDNKSRWIKSRGEKIKIGGVGDLWRDIQDIRPTLEGTSKDDFVILLSHNPDYKQQVPTDRVDLMLCGHTHGGQVTFFGLFAPFLPIKSGQKYRSGVVQEGPMTIVISRGIGSIRPWFFGSMPPLRFFSPPEIVLIKLEHAEG